jgi:hypothetical protein
MDLSKPGAKNNLAGLFANMPCPSLLQFWTRDLEISLHRQLASKITPVRKRLFPLSNSVLWFGQLV